MAKVQDQSSSQLEKFIDLESCDKLSTSSINDNDSAFSDEKNKSVGNESTDDVEQEAPDNQDDEQIYQLHSSWTMWLKNGNVKNNGDSCTWDQGLDQIFTFNTVNDFWSMYHHIQTPSNVRHKMDYLMFRENIQPKWEDEKNKNGGMWKLVIPKEKRKEVLDIVWLESLLSIIGETYGEETDYIMGVCVQRRQREDRLQLWLTGCDDATVKNIGETLKKNTLNLTSETKLYYLKHADQYLNNESWKVQANKSAKFTV